MDQAHLFVRAFIDYIEDATQTQGLNHSAIARAAFPEQRDPIGTYRKIRNMNQNLRLQDAYRLSVAVGQDFASICWKISQSIESYAVAAPFKSSLP